MKKSGLLNQPLMNVIAGMGHLDMLVIADAGLPIPTTTNRIDLAVTSGIPPMLDVLRAVLDELQVEAVIIAAELQTQSPHMYTALMQTLGDISVETISHVEFKQRTRQAKAVVRTGEFTPYANVILVAGVTF